jgi:ABC-type branched-subunit amino acid transport system substrate-binding protein
MLLPPPSARHATRAHRRRAHALAGALAALCLLATGCGGPAGDSSGHTSSCSSPGVSPTQIQLGLLFPDTGSSESLFEPFRAGVDARLGVANAAGGVHGRKVTYTWRDDESTPQANLAGAVDLVRGGAFAVVEGTSVASGSAPYLHRAGIPVVGTSLEVPWTVYDNMFSYSNLLAGSGSVSTYGDFVAAHGGHNALIVATRISATSQALATELAASLRSAGVQVAGTLDASAPIDFAALGKKIRDSGADTLVGAVTGGTFGGALLAALGAGVHLTVALSPAGYDQRILDSFKTIVAGAYFVVNFLPFEADRPAHREFVAAMLRYSPEIMPANQQAALSGWISADLMLRGLQGAGDCPTRQSLLAALRSIRDYTADGLLTQPVDFQTGFGALTRCLSFVQVTSDGMHFTPVAPLPECGHPIAG